MATTFRIASYNVKNMFERPRAMRLETWEEGKPILEQHARIHALIHQAQHAFLDKAAGFVAHTGPFDAGLPAAFRDRFGEEDNRSDDFVIVLHVVDELELVLGKVLRSRHAIPPL